MRHIDVLLSCFEKWSAGPFLTILFARLRHRQTLMSGKLLTISGGLVVATNRDAGKKYRRKKMIEFRLRDQDRPAQGPM